MSNKASVDSNVLLYMLDEEDSGKKIISLQLIRNKPYFSTQALSEVINICRKRWKYDKKGWFLFLNFFLRIVS